VPRTSPSWSRRSRAPRGADDFERTVLFHAFAIQMNLISPLWFAIRVFRQMKLQEGTGSIINISSGAGHPAGSPTLVSYGAAKAGLNHMTRSLAEEWGPKARVNCLALGPTMTDNFRSFVLPADDPEGRRLLRQGAPRSGRPSPPRSPGRGTCVFLCSGEADYINGTTIEIDGGMLPGVLYEAGPEDHHGPPVTWSRRPTGSPATTATATSPHPSGKRSPPSHRGGLPAGGSTFYGTGMNPGLAQILSVVATAGMGRVDHLTVLESVDVSCHHSVDTWKNCGYGRPVDDPRCPACWRRAARCSPTPST
jgi:hypothetical protein